MTNETTSARLTAIETTAGLGCSEDVDRDTVVLSLASGLLGAYLNLQGKHEISTLPQRVAADALPGAIEEDPITPARAIANVYL